MIVNYIRIAIRNILKHKGFAAINIAGLSIGIAASILLFMVVRYELSYDKFQPAYDHIYHITTEDKTQDGTFYNPGIPAAALNTLRLKFPQAKIAALNASYGSQFAVMGRDSSLPAAPKKFAEETGVFFMEPEFFDVFGYTWLEGNPSVLREPNSVVLSRSVAEKYFGSWSAAVGQYLKMDNLLTLYVRGIIADPPANTDFPLHVATSFITLRNNAKALYFFEDWNNTNSNFQLYMRLPENVTAASINKELQQFSREQFKDNGGTVRTVFIRPLKEVHFDTRVGTLGDHITSKSILWTLSLIGVLIIVMACINFINLATAQAIGRSREVGLRKVLGGTRRQLIAQIMGETGVIVFISILLGIALAYLCTPYLDQLVNIQEKLSPINGPTLAFIFGLFLFITFLSGSYPALVVSGFTPALAIKNKVSSARVGKISLRRGLVVLQFAISQLLIIGTIVALSQMRYIRNADLGFRKDAILVLRTNADSAAIARQEAFKQELLQIPGVQRVSFSADVPSSDNNWGGNFAFDGRDDEKFAVFMKFGDENYLDTYGLKLLAGRGFSRSDTINEMVINETLMKKLDVKNPADAIGKTIRLGRGPWKPITGVVRDFKANSLREEMKPMLIAPRKKFYTVTGIQLSSANIPGLQAQVQKAWDKYFPEYVNSTQFLDESIANFYRQDEKLAFLYKFFAALAILISCMGLYGLVSFMAVQRTKEVGIRKVLGASASSIVYLFSKEFTLLIIIAFAIAAPFAWYMMNNWLSNFAYRIPIGAGVFILAIIVSLFIAWITVGYKALGAALANPVKSLRTE